MRRRVRREKERRNHPGARHSKRILDDTPKLFVVHREANVLRSHEVGVPQSETFTADYKLAVTLLSRAPAAYAESS